MNQGDIIGDRYRLDRKIGQGGTGRIWLAQDGRLDRRVAIKFLSARSPAHRARLAKRVALEAKIAASIQHRNVVQIFDFGTHDGTVPYIVMEALSGFTLGDAFDAAQSFSLDALIHMMSEVLRGLAAVHDAGIVHRDLKPENIFLVHESRGKLSPKLLDFGISRSLEPETRASAITTTEGMILGTPQYMSPEQACGDSRVDKRTDIYSIGTIMFEAFSGVVPFPASSTAELLIRVVQGNAPPLYGYVPQIGSALCAVVDKALAHDRGQRYAHAAEMLEALLAASLEVPAALDRQAPQFPPEAIRERIKWRRGSTDDSEDGKPTAHTTPETVQEPGVQRRARRRLRSSERPAEVEPARGALPLQAATVMIPRPQAAQSKLALWLVVAALAIFAVSLAAVRLLDRMDEPQGSGLIVVQAPATQPPAAAPPPTPNPAPEPAALAVPEEPAAAPSKKSGKARKPVAAEALPQMAAKVADAFSKQKGSVIACLNAHAADVEGASQLEVRLMIDRDGVAKDAELLPAEISRKPVAGCLKTAVAKMSFPRPDQPATFRVPLSWRRK